MAEVVCSECGKTQDTLVCEQCFKNLQLNYEQLAEDLSDTLESLTIANRRIAELEDRIKECEQCKNCEALHKLGGDIIEPKD